MSRAARQQRITGETSVLVELDLDGTGAARVSTGVPFFDHMLAQLAKHGLLDLTIQADGDIEIDAHHTVEDTAITLGQASPAATRTTSSRPSSRRWPGRCGRRWRRTRERPACPAPRASCEATGGGA